VRHFLLDNQRIATPYDAARPLSLHFGSPTEEPRRVSTVFLPLIPSCPDTPPTRARGAIPCPSPQLAAGSSPAPAQRPAAAGQIARPSAGPGPIWSGVRDRVPGGFPHGGLGSHRARRGTQTDL
jgi:hypothetical protein